ncbi:MAG: DPP IV N-terminal domain-containing protein [Chloroflexota bacterium]
MLAFDLATGQKRLLRETSEVWINLLTSSIRSKSGHETAASSGPRSARAFAICICMMRMGEIRPLTHGDWQVDSLAGVDAENEVVYFIANKDAPTESPHQVSLLGGEPHPADAGPGCTAWC